MEVLCFLRFTNGFGALFDSTRNKGASALSHLFGSPGYKVMRRTV